MKIGQFWYGFDESDGYMFDDEEFSFYEEGDFVISGPNQADIFTKMNGSGILPVKTGTGTEKTERRRMLMAWLPLTGRIICSFQVVLWL